MSNDAKKGIKDDKSLMEDGTLYAGISPDTGKPMYTTPADAPLTCTFNEAQKYVEGLNKQKAHGHDDWRLPTKDELNVLFKNYAAIGGFSETFGFGGRFARERTDYVQRVGDGNQRNHERADLSLRCVRG